MALFFRTKLERSGWFLISRVIRLRCPRTYWICSTSLSLVYRSWRIVKMSGVCLGTFCLTEFVLVVLIAKVSMIRSVMGSRCQIVMMVICRCQIYEYHCYSRSHDLGGDVWSVLKYYGEINYIVCRESLGFPSLNMVSDLIRRLLRMVRRASSNF